MNVICITTPITSLDAKTRAAMWTLFAQHYTGLSAEIFEADLIKKNQAILLYREDELVGFTSLGSQQIADQQVVYSGDIIIAPTARDIGSAHFFHQWACAVWQKYDWWCLLTSGPRTYRIAHTFYRRVTPREGESDSERELRHRFARSIYGEQYRPETGLVKLEHSYQIQAHTGAERTNYPLANTFEQLNPDWKEGDELVSLISLHPDNWKPVARRMLNWQKK